MWQYLQLSTAVNICSICFTGITWAYKHNKHPGLLH